MAKVLIITPDIQLEKGNLKFNCQDMENMFEHFVIYIRKIILVIKHDALFW